MERTVIRGTKALLLNVIALIAGAFGLAASDYFTDPVSVEREHAPTMTELVIPYEGGVMTGLYYGAGGPGPKPTIILLHAFPGFEKNLDMAQALRRRGYNILFFHYRGTWGSGGHYSWSNSLEDVHTAVDYLKEEKNAQAFKVDTGNIILVGHSWGGMLSIKAGAARDDIRCVASIAPEDWTQWLGSKEDQQTIINYLNGIHSVEGYPSEKALQDLIDEQQKWQLSNIVQDIGNKKFLLVSGEWDTAFDDDMRKKMVSLARAAGTKEITSFTVESADHSFSARRIELITRTGHWLDKECLDR